MLHLFQLSRTVEKILFNISIIILVIAICFGWIIISWLVQPSRILAIYNEPIPEVRADIKSGDTVIFIINYCKLVNAKGIVNWYIVGNSSVTFLPSYVDNTPKSCNKNLLDPVIVPPQLKPGTYYIVWQVTYPVNPLKQDYVEFRSRDFILVK